jgi:hypothetical protein
METEMTRPVPAGLSALSSIRPAAPESAPDDTPLAAANRALAQAHGFAPRDTVEQRNRRRAPAEAVRSFTTRVNTRDANAFIEWCDNERISYREGFGRMVRFFLDAQPRQ